MKRKFQGFLGITLDRKRRFSGGTSPKWEQMGRFFFLGDECVPMRSKGDATKE